MKITVEITQASELELLLSILKQFQLDNVQIVPQHPPSIQQGDKSIDPRSLFGIWKNNPRTLDDIRSNAWKRN